MAQPQGGANPPPETPTTIDVIEQAYLCIPGFPSKHHLAPNREVIDRVGVAPDHHVPLTPKDAAAGRDPALAKALTLLQK
jgi:hypothetical protein